MIAIPCAPLLRTPELLRMMGPRAFGYDFDYVPFGTASVAHPVAAYTETPSTSIRTGELT